MFLDTESVGKYSSSEGTSITTTPDLAPRALLAVLASLAGITAFLLLVVGVSTASLGLAALVVAPIAIYVALKRPLDFPLGLYVLLIPFDNLLATGSFGTLTKLLGIGAGIAILLWVARRRRVAFAGRPVLVLCALMVWMLASALWAVDQSAALKIMPTYAGLMLLYIVLTMMPISPAQFRILLFLVVAGGLSAAAFGIHAFYHDPTFSQESPAMLRLIVQVGQNHIDPNHFSDALLFPIAIVTMWALRSRKVLVKLACMGVLGVLVVAVLFSGSREGLTAIFLIAAYYMWRSRYRFQVAVAAVALLACAAAARTSVWLRFATALQTGGSGRTSIWAVAVEAAKHRFLQGYGIGNFTEAFDLFYLGVHQPYPYGWESPAHNLVLHYLVEIGIIGLGLIGAFIVAQFGSLRVIDKSSDLYDYRLMMEASLLATVTVAMTIDLFTYKYAWLVFSMVALLRNVYVGRLTQRADANGKVFHDAGPIGAFRKRGFARIA